MIADPERGYYADSRKVHAIDREGRFLSRGAAERAPAEGGTRVLQAGSSAAAASSPAGTAT